ncbi:septum formation family protein [Dactylosporangium sp. AC04546]|uniref:septum formation family protein n=1 Tax=Dactylosporangium sp. AC04546 TaxID=2862460 RepID=UPI001EDCEB6A|nr:septum formation family protein [Dactylosporangium sp. AC04546]WVK88212.1 septum formation family protein [Dactylosporangium sp. AC04546]
MRTKILVAVLVLAAGGSVFLWWRDASSGNALGCYTAPVVAELMPDSGAVQAVDCARPHDFEAIAVLAETGAEERCRQEAESFLGGPWEQSRAVYALLRSTDRMRGELLCALAETSGTDQRPIGSVSSLKDGMRGERPLAITCLVTGEDEEFLYGDCTQSHAAEFVGVVPPGDDTETACRQAAAAYLGVPDLQQRTDLGVSRLSRENELCLVTEVPDASGRHDTLRASVKGLGAGPLPR